MRVSISSKPGASTRNKTGSWRIDKRPEFLQKDCIACNLCAQICPEGIISGDGKNTYETQYEFCKGCGLCAAICPKDDIEMVPEGDE